MYNTKKRPDKHTVKTDDGSLTMYSEEFDEHYHSTGDGALLESLQKHIIPALALQKNKGKLTILDICFGIGYNTLSTIYYIQKEKLDTQVHIISPEFDEGLVRSLKDFEYPPEFAPLKPIIEAISENMHYEDEQFRIDVIIGDAREVVRDIEPKFDIIYQDPFSPAKNPTLWTQEWFADIRTVSHDDAILTTYSIAAAIRLGLYESDWQIHQYQSQTPRRSLIASPSIINENRLPKFEWIDVELKKQRNPEARSLRDEKL